MAKHIFYRRFLSTLLINPYAVILQENFLRTAVVIFCLTFGLPLFGQSTATVHTETSFVIGGKVGYYPRYFRNTLIIRSGVYGNVSMLKEVKNQLSLGGGMGFIAVNRETFVPVFVQMRARLSDNPSGFYFDVKSGYGPGFNGTYNRLDDMKYRGGWFLSTTFGYNHQLENDLTFQFGLQWVHQNASLRTQLMDHVNVEPLRFHFMGIMMGFIF
ncbi:MAG: hypothetical protein JJU02_11175 [Cryomorphaceae bacterium]|nr:hypothetical protein [Cryomorphaceae bacterium]